MRIKLLSAFLLVWAANPSFSQVSINNFEYIDLPLNAHLAGVGSMNVSIPDVNMVFQNPALIDTSMAKIASLSYVPYFAGVKNNSASYVHNFHGFGPVAMGVQYLTSGKMQQTDEFGNEMGTYASNQYVLQAGTSRKQGNFLLGLNLKFAGSQIGTYSSYAMMTDIGALFKHPKADWTIGMVARNVGFALKKYTPGEQMSMPLDILLGTSYKLEHMPFRLSVTVQQTKKLDITYLDSTQSTALNDQGQPILPHKTLGDMILRHFILGGEFFIGKAFTVRMGYNFLRRKELKLETKPGLAGFSIGAAIKINAFEFAFTEAWYAPSGGSSFLTLNTTLSTLFKKKTHTAQL